jgi:hypothetical protein
MSTEYVWEEMYKAALVETDIGKLPTRVQAAKAAIDNRLHELQLGHGGLPEERLAMSDALAGLIILRRELQSINIGAARWVQEAVSQPHSGSSIHHGRLYHWHRSCWFQDQRAFCRLHNLSLSYRNLPF